VVGGKHVRNKHSTGGGISSTTSAKKNLSIEIEDNNTVKNEESDKQ
jgi:hypothetical protein